MWIESNPVELISAYLKGLGLVADHHTVWTGLVLTTALIAVSRAIRTAKTPTASSYQTRLQHAMPQLREAVAVCN